ncbi:MAG: glycosyltransferase family A protein [Planctomycetia bacterium]|nr:glycosyltransferase family A protein [Planctomycetia bacterium]
METKKSAVSVIIPTYRRGAQIRVSAAKIQEYLGPEDELILVDQTETPSDETKTFYESLLRDSRVSIYYSAQKSSGQARNTGAFFSRGEVLLFWDDDLEPVGNVVEQHRKWYQKPDVYGVAGCYWGNYLFQPKGNADAWNFAAGHISLRRDVFFQVGGFNTNLVYPFIPEDYELHTRLAKYGGGAR